MVKPGTSKNIEALFVEMLQFAWGDWHKVIKTSSYYDPIHVIVCFGILLINFLCVQHVSIFIIM